MRKLVLDFVCKATGRDSSQFLHLPDEDLFEMFVNEIQDMVYKSAVKSYAKKRELKKYGKALAKAERNKYQW